MKPITTLTDHAHLEVRQAARDRTTIHGYAAVFDSPSRDLGGFVEVIKPGAFADVLADPGLDVSCRIQHEGGLTTIGRTTNGTLRLREDGRGLAFEADVPATEVGRDLVRLIREKYIDKMSFAFRSNEDHIEWKLNQNPPLRIIHKVIELADVAPVDGAAYKETSVQVRKAGQGQLELAKLTRQIDSMRRDDRRGDLLRDKEGITREGRALAEALAAAAANGSLHHTLRLAEWDANIQYTRRLLNKPARPRRRSTTSTDNYVDELLREIERRRKETKDAFSDREMYLAEREAEWRELCPWGPHGAIPFDIWLHETERDERLYQLDVETAEDDARDRRVRLRMTREKAEREAVEERTKQNSWIRRNCRDMGGNHWLHPGTFKVYHLDDGAEA